MLRRFALALLAWSTVHAGPAATAQCSALEQEGPPRSYASLHRTAGDFRNVRGFTYLAVYPSLNVLGSRHNGNLEWRGVASPTAMWENYEPGGETAAAVQQQLTTLKSFGVNTVRVFMSFPAWEFHHQESLRTGRPNAYNVRIADFFVRCRLAGIRCVPVIWDNTGVGTVNEPTYGSAADYYSARLFHNWHSNPGVTKMRRMLGNGGGTFVGTLAETYINDLVNAASRSDSVAVWEIMNEPFGFDPQFLAEMVTGTIHILDAATSLPIMLGLPYWDHSMHVCARLPEIDVLSIHHYAFFSTNASLESQVHNTSHIRLDPNQPTQAPFVRKPLLLSETGSPGFGHHYADAIDQAERVRRLDLGPNETGIGFLSFPAMVGWQEGNYPFKHQGGLLYGDCTVRDLSVVHRLLAAANLSTEIDVIEKSPATTATCPQGQPATTNNPPYAGYVAQAPISKQLDNYADRVAWMNAQPTDFLSVGHSPGCPPDFAAYTELRYMFMMAYHSATAAHDLATFWLATAARVSPPGLPNGNRFAEAAVAPAFTVMPAATRAQIDAHIDATELLIDSHGHVVPTAFTNSLLSQSSVGPRFDPSVHPEHLALLCFHVFEPWRVAMKDYVIAQQ